MRTQCHSWHAITRSRSFSPAFTLLEVLLTIILLAVAFTALAEALSSSLFVGGDNESSLVALNLAGEKMETIKNTAYASIANEAKAAVSGFSPFQREVIVTTPSTSLKQVSVVVYWNNKAAELTYNLVTYVSNI